MTAEACTCWVTDPKTWTRYGSAVEPGSMWEPNPDCPEHFPKARQVTAEGAGVAGRERMAQIALDHLLVQADDNRYDSPYVNDESLDSVFIDGRVNLHLLADAILAAGFGDKAAAWDEGLEVGGSNYGEGYGETNPYRTAGTP